jgi:hypothetical protein
LNPMTKDRTAKPPGGGLPTPQAAAGDGGGVVGSLSDGGTDL